MKAKAASGLHKLAEGETHVAYILIPLILYVYDMVWFNLEFAFCYFCLSNSSCLFNNLCPINVNRSWCLIASICRVDIFVSVLVVVRDFTLCEGAKNQTSWLVKQRNITNLTCKIPEMCHQAI